MEIKNHICFCCIIIKRPDGRLMAVARECLDEGEYESILASLKKLGTIKENIYLDHEQTKNIGVEFLSKLRCAGLLIEATVNTHLAIRQKLTSESNLRRCAL